MATKARALGRGLDSLFANAEDWETSIQEISIGDLDPNTDQPRKIFHEEALAELAESIKNQGVLQPLLVVATNNGRYRIIAGERRFRASRQAGLETVPCIVKDLDVVHQMEISLIENLQREDLNPMETARGIKALKEQCGYTQEKISARLGKSRPAVANLLRLVNLPEEVTVMVEDGRLSAGHARVLAGLTDAAEQVRLANRVVAEGLNVRQLEKLATESRPEKKAAGGNPHALEPELRELQERILEKTGMKSRLTGTVSRGRIVLEYSTRDELEHFYEVLNEIGG